MSFIEIRIANRIVVGPCIAKGASSSIYSGRNAQTGQEVAIKAQSLKQNSQVIGNQRQILERLQGGVGIPFLYLYEKTVQHQFLVLDLLGNSLEDYFNHCGRSFSLKTVILIADQLISLLQFIHSKGVIHRDLNPHNFLMGTGKRNHLIHAIDFGLSCLSDQVQQSADNLGCLRFSSPQVLADKKHSFKTDLHALGIMLVYFMKGGKLPWQGIRQPDLSSKQKKVQLCKEKVFFQQLCRGLPSEFSKFFQTINEMKEDQPRDYYLLKRIFKQKLVLEQLDYDYIFDWFLIPFSIKNLKSNFNFPIKTHFDQSKSKLSQSWTNILGGKISVKTDRKKIIKLTSQNAIKKDSDRRYVSQNKKDVRISQKKKKEEKNCLVF